MIRSSIRLLAVSLVAVGATAGAQTLTDRVNSAPAGLVQFNYPSRADVCGNGRSYIQTGNNSFTGSFSDGMRLDPCTAGPARVVVDRADGQVISVQAYVGPLQKTAGATDLGHVSGQQAADYLLGLAAKAEGRAGRDAIMPAMLADSAQTADALVAIARNQALPRETRRSALTNIGRSTDDMAVVPARVIETLTSVARDETDNQVVRQEAIASLGRLAHGAGVQPLVDLAKPGNSMWMTKEALTGLSRSGDPRARAYLRTASQREDLSDDALIVAIRALGQEYATAQDATLLRGLYPKLRTDRARDAVESALADIGGQENVKWLLAIVRDEDATATRRRRSIDQAVRAGAPIADLVAVYDATGDQQVKESLVSAYVRSGEKVAIDKLLWVVRNETNVNVRKYAISQLQTSDDPRVRQALKDLISK